MRPIIELAVCDENRDLLPGTAPQPIEEVFRSGERLMMVANFMLHQSLPRRGWTCLLIGGEKVCWQPVDYSPIGPTRGGQVIKIEQPVVMEG